MSQLSAIIVDDERLARKELRAMLARHPEIEVLGEADSVRRARDLIRQLKPQVVFLDIQMPGESGFGLLDHADEEFKVIFVTAYDAYAIRAFEVNALDYLLKPISPDRLARAIERLRASEETSEKSIIEKSAKKLDYDDFLFLTTDNRPRFVKVSAIACVSAEGDYSQVYTADGKSALVLTSLKDWEERLPPKHFVRIHRSSIINFEYVDRVEEWFNYSYRVYLRNIPTPFTISRRYAARLKERMK